MIETYGRLLAGSEYRLDSGTACSLANMGKAEIVPEPAKKRVKKVRKSVVE